MKVWIEQVKVTGVDGWPTQRWDVVHSEGHSVAANGLTFLSRVEAGEWARAENHQVMDIPRPKRR